MLFELLTGGPKAAPKRRSPGAGRRSPKRRNGAGKAAVEAGQEAPSAPLDRGRAGAAAAAAARTCAKRLEARGFDLRGYTTRESAADLEDLRRALGAEKISLWGISYGTHLALAALRDFGPRIDRVVLAGVEGPDETYKLPSDQEELLQEIAKKARPQVPDLAGTLRGVLAELKARPKPVLLSHPLTGEAGSAVVGALDLQVVIAQMLTGPETFAALPDFVTRLAAGDWMALALRAAPLRFEEAPIAMATAMDCASGATAARRARIAAEAALRARRQGQGRGDDLPAAERPGGTLPARMNAERSSADGTSAPAPS